MLLSLPSASPLITLPLNVAAPPHLTLPVTITCLLAPWPHRLHHGQRCCTLFNPAVLCVSSCPLPPSRALASSPVRYIPTPVGSLVASAVLNVVHLYD
ncbi:hypothetical protein BD779DRAFT_1564567 [Infundibulicybe gibba]|nr:hypothetical protein BD779DRAFT_1564567 [Infundibulicybe gibba]